MRLKKRFVFAGCLVAFLSLAACGDDDSDFATRPSGDSSSSVCEDSSCVILSGDSHEGSSPASSSSAKSSSSVSSQSSSGETNVSSSSEIATSSSSRKTAWDYLNPNIDYGEMVDDRDGQTYKTVTIGTQVWMAENINFEAVESFCYNDDVANCSKYGRLYIWPAAVGKLASECGHGNGMTCLLPSGNVQGVCPEGWHLPSMAEWDTLFNAVGGQSTAAKVLKSTSGWSGGNGTDAFGFSALPAGYWEVSDFYFSDGLVTYFWSSTEYDGVYASYIYLGYGHDNATPNKDHKYYGFSVRCIQD